ncbi:MAG: hemerythrin domain-containing protein [Alphaproteobacteria bacterium]|nr:hemerythrin domain-containing protein [Alphaproteobacteria bacterium]
MPEDSQHLRLVEDGLAGSADANDPISILEADHAAKLRLCECLENVADGLPHSVDVRVAENCIQILRAGLPAHVALEEGVLFPLIRRRFRGDLATAQLLQQLELEHSSDDLFASEIADELELLAAVRTPRNPEMMGYMLRGFFTSLRRHVEWENAIVLSLARRLLIIDDLAELTAAIEKQRREDPGRKLLEALAEEGFIRKD